MTQNNHEVFAQHQDISDGNSHEDGVKNPELRAKVPAKLNLSEGSGPGGDLTASEYKAYIRNIHERDATKQIPSQKPDMTRKSPTTEEVTNERVTKKALDNSKKEKLYQARA